MNDFETFALTVCKRSEMFVSSESFAALCAYLNGFDVARDHGPLMGFHPWLVLRRDYGDNMPWELLVMREGLGEIIEMQNIDALLPEQNRLCKEKLSQLLSEFFEVRQQNFVTGILHDYAKWLQSRNKWPLRR